MRLPILFPAQLVMTLAFWTTATIAAVNPEEFEQKILEELQKTAPMAVVSWNEANAARSRGDMAAAAALYNHVREMAPNFVHAIRRQCGCEGELGHKQAALALCEEALRVADSPENLAALAMTLVMSDEASGEPDQHQKDRAFELARLAEQNQPDDPYIEMVLCQTAVITGHMDVLRHGAGRLLAIAPDQAYTHLFGAIAAASEGHWTNAHASLNRAHALGLPEETYKSIDRMIRKATPWYIGAWAIALRVLPPWVGVAVLLVILGAVLSKVTLRASRRVPVEASGRATGVDAVLRKVYGVVLWLCCGYYFVSIPIVLALVVVTGGGLIYAFFALGRIPLQLVAMIALGVVVTVWSIFRSLFLRMREEDPGLRLDASTHPKLRALLDNVAETLGTRPVDNIYITPGTEVAVMERGGILRQLRGATERCLILGAGVLDGFTQGSFKAVLAHEYGHFINQDTAGGGFSLAVQRSIHGTALGLVTGGAAAWYNPAWLFLVGFDRVFLRISHGASRLQEVLADRWAAFSYGSEAFERGLRHVMERSVRFDAHMSATLNEVVQSKGGLANIYCYALIKPLQATQVDEVLEKALAADASEYDSHPAPKDRFAWIRQLAAPPVTESADDSRPVWDLFSDREEIERLMTSVVRDNIWTRYMVNIPGDPAELECAAKPD